MIDIVSGILSNLGAARTIASGLVDIHDAHVVSTIQADLTERILNAQAQLAQVLAAIIEKDGRIAALEDRCRELERQKLQHSRYQLAEISPVTKVIAYRLKPPGELTENASEIPHFACQSCLDTKNMRVILIRKENSISIVHVCPLCKTELLESKKQNGYFRQADYDPYP